MLYFIAGAILAFLGFMPPGNINLQVIQMAASHRKRELASFIGGAAIVEFIYCFMVIKSMEWITRHEIVIKILNWAIIPTFIGLAIYMFLKKEEHPKGKPMVAMSMMKGFLMNLTNPVQIPFWLIWGLYMLNNGWIDRETKSIVIFSLGSMLGAFLGLGVFAYTGHKLFQKIDLNQKWLNRIIGMVFIGLAVYQLVRLIKGQTIH